MKKFVLSLVALLIVMSLVPAALAAGTPAAALTNGAADPGQAAVLTLSLSNLPKATAMAVLVEGMPVLGSKWLLAGDLDAFNTNTNRGVWSCEAAQDLNGDVLDLAFLVPQDPQGKTEFPVKVTVQVMNGSQVVATLTANGKVLVRKAATGVSLDKTTLALDLSGSKTAVLTAAVTPADSSDAVVWSTSDETVVSVANGTVTALKAGTATVTVTVGQFKASCTVTVACRHTNATKVAAMESSCVVTGHKEHYSCSDCGVLLASDKQTVVTMAELKLPLGNHTQGKNYSSNEAQHWTVCVHCNTPGTAENHTFAWVVDKEPTQNEPGIQHEECVCGRKRSENTPVDKLGHDHVATKHPMTPATCAAQGNVEHWTCSHADCAGKFYADEACTVVLSTVVIEKNPSQHVAQTVLKNKVAATCTAEGYTGDTHCAGCDALLEKGQKTEKTDHTFHWVIDRYASELAPGSKHEECSACKEKRGTAVEIPQLVHSPYAVAAKEPTCHEGGNIAYFYCPNCGNYYANEGGKIGKVLSRNEVFLPATDHNIGPENPWESDQSGHWQVCTCGEKTDVQSHKTVLENASQTYTGDEVCDVCGYVVKKGEVIETKPAETQPAATTAPAEPPATTAPSGTEPTGSDGEGKVIFPWWILLIIAAVGTVTTAVANAKKKR